MYSIIVLQPQYSLTNIQVNPTIQSPASCRVSLWKLAENIFNSIIDQAVDHEIPEIFIEHSA